VTGLYGYDYLYDPADGSRFREIHDRYSASGDVAFTFDSLDRLVEVSRIATPGEKTTYAYDLNGNRTRKTTPVEEVE